MSNSSSHKFHALLILITIVSIIALAMSLWAHTILRFPGDLQISLLLQSIDDGKLRSVMEWISWPFGGFHALVTTIMIAALVWWRAGKRAGFMILTAGLLTTVNYLLKDVIGRPRPTSDMVQVFASETGNGFPSGHAVFTTLVLGMLAYLVASDVRKSFRRTSALAGLVALILLVGISRVYLGVHWASDVIGGYLVGTSLLLGLIWLYRWRTKEDAS